MMLTRLNMKTRRLVLWMVATLFVGASLVWWRQETGNPVSATDAAAPVDPADVPIKTGVATTPVDSRLAISRAPKETAAPLVSHESEDPLSPKSAAAFSLRRKAVRSLRGKALERDEAEALRAFVADTGLPQGLTLNQMRTLKNDMFNILGAQVGAEEDTATLFQSVYSDGTQDPAIRDYALQHLDSLAERDPRVNRSAHWDALKGDNASLAATALLHLSRQHQRGELSADEGSRIEAGALRLARNAAAKDPSRATAIQVCACLKLAEARPLAWELARSEKTSVPLRIAAVAALGDLGDDAEVRDYLTALATGSEKRLRVPAASALRRFSNN